MTPFTVCDALGRVLRTGSVPQSVLSFQAGPGEHVLPVAVQSNQYVIGLDTDSPSLEYLPTQPSYSHVFDYESKQWVDPRTLQDLRDEKWGEIKQARTAAEYGGFDWHGSTFDSDATSQARIQGAVQLAGLSADFSIDWTLADNSVRALSAADMIAVGAALGLHVSAQFAKARVLREQIEAASAEELTLLDW